MRSNKIEPRRHEDHEDTVQKHNFERLSKDVVDCCFQVHQKLGSGLLEDLYQEPLCIELEKKRLSYELEKQIPVYYDGLQLKRSCRLDFVVEGLIVLELKAVEKILPVHEAQILTYLKVADLKTGFIVNFKDPYFKTAIKRFVL
ncbi:MAG: GxxExxY protein [Magnetococcus sp. WYHC-3]